MPLAWLWPGSGWLCSCKKPCGAPGCRTLDSSVHWHELCLREARRRQVRWCCSVGVDMMRQRLALILIAGCIPLVASTHCGSSDRPGGNGAGAGGSSATSGGDVVLPLGGSAGEASGSGSPLNPLCGGFLEQDCSPDDERALACTGVELGTGGTGGSGGTTGGGPGGGEGGESRGGMAGEFNEGGASGEGGAPASGGIPIDGGPDVSVPGDPGVPTGGIACQVRAGEEGPLRVCATAGSGVADDPCTSAADCSAGFACIGEGEAGLCRRYCCEGAERSCEAGRFCAERKQFGSDLVIPVCARADNCSLSQPYPCAGEDQCQCAEGTACMVVRGDGTTTCVVPGAGTAGEACPCGWGHVCSQASGTCLKLCETVSTEDQCNGGVCQAAANLPANWGVCIDTGNR